MDARRQKVENVENKENVENVESVEKGRAKIPPRWDSLQLEFITLFVFFADCHPKGFPLILTSISFYIGGKTSSSPSVMFSRSTGDEQSI